MFFLFSCAPPHLSPPHLSRPHLSRPHLSRLRPVSPCPRAPVCRRPAAPSSRGSWNSTHPGAATAKYVPSDVMARAAHYSTTRFFDTLLFTTLAPLTPSPSLPRPRSLALAPSPRLLSSSPRLRSSSPVPLPPPASPAAAAPGPGVEEGRHCAQGQGQCRRGRRHHQPGALPEVRRDGFPHPEAVPGRAQVVRLRRRV